MDFSNKTVIVTGAGAGVGRAIAIGFCSDGANVVGFARSRSDLEETARHCPVEKMLVVAGDVSKAEDVKRLFSEATDRFGKIDILVNNAAVYPKVEFLASTHEEWSRVIEINVIGMALCCRLALPGMLERGFGRILNLGSFAGRNPIPKSSGYSVSKAAVGPLTKSLATEIDRSKYPDVLINEFMPGIVKTRMSDAGEDPAAIYPHARYVASLPCGGPTGQTFVQSTQYVENPGRRARLKRLLAKASFGLVKG